MAPSTSAPCPTSFRYWEQRERPAIRRLDRLARKVLRDGLFPSDEVARAFTADLHRGDPVAERFVAEVFGGEIGPKRGRALLERALTDGIDAVPEAPEAMRALFAEFETVPDWVRPDLVERGAAIWRRWGTMLFAMAGAETLEMYTEAAVTTPLSLAGGYAGDNALRRFLETTRFWIDVSAPEAILTPGSAGRATALKVRVMHVSVRGRVSGHREWDPERWGLPISQSYMVLTLLAGSLTPAAGLWPLGHPTTPAEIRALLHFQRYMGHLLGVRVDWYPDTIAEAARLMAMVGVARSYDAGEQGAELIRSYPAAFAPRPEQRGLARLRQSYNYRLHSAYTALFMLPTTRGRYDLPPAFPWLLIPLLRTPAVFAAELVRRTVPGAAGLYERVMVAHRENWYRSQMRGRQAQFDATGALRR
ncbi:oxygenase MpaB family protein [Nocardia takedensis]